jgi:hypothetical protein
MNEDPDTLVTLTTAEGQFAAHTIVAVLQDAGIEAVAFDATAAGLGIGLYSGMIGVPVQVRRADLERAQAALNQNASDSIDVDWSAVDVGQQQDAPADNSALARTMFKLGRWWMLGVALFVLAIILLARAIR